MSDPPSTSNDTARPPQQPWQRFTLLDALVLQAGFALGLAVAGWFLPHPERVGPYLTSWLRLFAGGLAGAVLSGPLVLAVQFRFRGRRPPLSAGEWIWTGAAAMPAAIFAVVLLRTWWTWELHLALYMAYLSEFAYLAILVPFVALDAIRRWNGVRRPVPCKWTDAFGRGLVLTFGGLCVLLIAIVSLGSLPP